jgi:hypothetical protein
MKIKILLPLFVFITGCIHSNASGIIPADPGKGISEIAGSIVDTDTKKPLKEVAITAYLDSKKEKHVLSDESGKFDFGELKSGTYKLVFEKDGYKKVTKNKVYIKSDETFQMRIEMIENQDFDLMPTLKYFFDSK